MADRRGGDCGSAMSETPNASSAEHGPVRAHRAAARPRQHGHHPFYGSRANPSVSHYYTLGGRPVSVWALYLRPTRPVLNMRVGALFEVVERSGVGVPAGPGSRAGPRRGAWRHRRGRDEPVPAPRHRRGAHRSGGSRALLCRARADNNPSPSLSQRGVQPPGDTGHSDPPGVGGAGGAGLPRGQAREDGRRVWPPALIALDQGHGRDAGLLLACL
jgi:hypothetical protein